MKRRSQTSSDPLSVGRLMSRLMARTGYDREQSASAVADAWREAAPPAFRDTSRAGTIRRGVLDVFVSHSAHVQEFGFHKQAILARLRELVPAAGISDIRCRLLADVDRTP
jgi:predicted nucleic acid-binding Zn ribbon protein